MSFQIIPIFGRAIAIVFAIALTSCATKSAIVDMGAAEGRPFLQVTNAPKVEVSVTGRSEMLAGAIEGAGGYRTVNRQHRSRGKRFSGRGRQLDSMLIRSRVDVVSIIRRACEERLKNTPSRPSGDVLKIEVVRYGVQNASSVGLTDKSRPFLTVKAQIVGPSRKVKRKGTYAVNHIYNDLVPALSLDSYLRDPIRFRAAIEKYAAQIASQMIQ